MTPDLSSRPRIEIHDPEGQIILVCYTKSRDYYNDYLVPKAESVNGTITVKPGKPPTQRVTTLKQRQAHQSFFRKQ